jgi:hypothetical protein
MYDLAATGWCSSASSANSSVQERKFWLVFRETNPQIAFTCRPWENWRAIQTEASAAPLAQRRSKLLIDFFWQVQHFQPLFDQLQADVDVAGFFGIIKPASPSRRFIGLLDG